MFNLFKKKETDVEKRLHYLENMEQEHRARLTALTKENSALKDKIEALNKENKETMELILAMNDDLLQLEMFYLDSTMVTDSSSSFAVEEAKPLTGIVVKPRNIKEIAKAQKSA